VLAAILDAEKGSCGSGGSAVSQGQW
jgi:hypothetical protein